MLLSRTLFQTTTAPHPPCHFDRKRSLASRRATQAPIPRVPLATMAVFFVLFETFSGLAATFGGMEKRSDTTRGHVRDSLNSGEPFLQLARLTNQMPQTGRSMELHTLRNSTAQKTGKKNPCPLQDDVRILATIFSWAFEARLKSTEGY